MAKLLKVNAVLVILVLVEFAASFKLINEIIHRNTRQASTCGVPRTQGIGLIIGGQNIERGSLPWMVALLGKSSGRFTFFCSGTLISKKTVVTGKVR